MKSTTRSNKEERRREIIEAATREFAVGGLYGTPVESIARQVGVSQPYLFQLFGTKKELFLAAVRRAFERTVATFRAAAAEAGADATPREVLMRMGDAYWHLIDDDRRLLLMQMQAYTASDDEDVRHVVQEEMLRLVRFVQSASGASDEDVREWLAYGMLMNVIAALDLKSMETESASAMCQVVFNHVHEHAETQTAGVAKVSEQTSAGAGVRDTENKRAGQTEEDSARKARGAGQEAEQKE